MKTMNQCSINKIDDLSFQIKAGGKTDYFIDELTNYRSANAPFYFQDIEGDFIIEAELDPDFQQTYDAGAILIYSNEDCWIKAAFELTDLGYQSIVTVVTDKISDDCNGERIDKGPVKIRVVRKNQYWAIHFSTDKKNWKMARYFSLNMPLTVQAGVSAQSPMGSGCSVQFSELIIKESQITNLRKSE